MGWGGGGLEGKRLSSLSLKIIFLCTICDVTFHAMTLPDKLSETLHLNAPCTRQRNKFTETVAESKVRFDFLQTLQQALSLIYFHVIYQTRGKVFHPISKRLEVG